MEIRPTAAERQALREELEARRLLTVAETVERVRLGTYTVASQSEPGVRHTVIEADGQAYCSCTGFRYRGMCSHIRAVSVYTVQQAEMRAAALPAALALRHTVGRAGLQPRKTVALV